MTRWYRCIHRRARRGTALVFVLVLMLILAIFTRQLLSSLAAKDRAVRERWRIRQAREIAELFARYAETKISNSDNYPGEIQLFELAEVADRPVDGGIAPAPQTQELAEVKIERYDLFSQSDEVTKRPYRIKVTINPKPGNMPDYVLESSR